MAVFRSAPLTSTVVPIGLPACFEKVMPNTKSAERRMRNSARKQLRNRSVKSRLKSLEKRYAAALKTANRGDASAALHNALSAFDKAVKAGVIHRNMADRKKSRLTTRLAALK